MSAPPEKEKAGAGGHPAATRSGKLNEAGGRIDSLRVDRKRIRAAGGLSLEEAKNRLDVTSLWRLLKIPWEPTRSCRCPFHEDRSASFSVFMGSNGAPLWKCFAGCGQGGQVEFLARARSISEAEACRELIELAGGSGATGAAIVRQPKPSAPPSSRKLILPADLHRGSRDDLRAVADLRGLSLEGVELASERGLLWFAARRGFPAWIVTDGARCNAQARRLDGGLWEHIGGVKACSLRGSRAAWPIGAREALPFQSIALVEGGPDLLAAHQVILREGRERDMGAIAMLGGANKIPGDALALLTGKRVRLFPHADPAGMAAAIIWTGQLESVKCRVDAFRFEGLERANGGASEGLERFLQHGRRCLRGRIKRTPGGTATMSAEQLPNGDAGRVYRPGGDGSPQPTARRLGSVPTDFPHPPGEAAFHGVAGEIVTALAPETEAHSVAILVHLLAAIGNIVGRDVYIEAGGARHHFNLFAVIVGATSRARKGTAWAAIQSVIDGLDSGWKKRRVISGLSSGEGLKWSVRDAITEPDDEEPSDPGEGDKRLFVIEQEFSNVLQMVKREGNTLSSVIRQAWDGMRLETLTKRDPVKATGAHVSIIGHITREELSGLLSRSDTFNGFANRFLWVASQRDKLLPEGGKLENANIATVLPYLREVITKTRGEMRRNEAATQAWARFYTDTAGLNYPGILGAVTSRAEAQTLRLSGLYALLDGSVIILPEHVAAAVALWDYCERSARWIFGCTTGNPHADAILAALAERGPNGMTRTEISAEVLKRNVAAADITAALNVLNQAGFARELTLRPTVGAPVQRWYAGRNEFNERNE